MSLCVTLGIRAGSKVSVVDPPPGFVGRLNPLPDGVEFLVTAQTGLDVVLFFARTVGGLVERLPALSRAMTLQGKLWLVWEQGVGALEEDLVRHAGLDLGLTDDKRADFGDGWMGLRFVRQSRPRPSRPNDRRPSIADA